MLHTALMALDSLVRNSVLVDWHGEVLHVGLKGAPSVEREDVPDAVAQKNNCEQHTVHQQTDEFRWPQQDHGKQRQHGVGVPGCAAHVLNGAMVLEHKDGPHDTNNQVPTDPHVHGCLFHASDTDLFEQNMPFRGLC
jgi:hypothetical protein